MLTVGKHSTSAQIAIMRKIILTAHSLFKNDEKYDENFNSQVVLKWLKSSENCYYWYHC